MHALVAYIFCLEYLCLNYTPLVQYLSLFWTHLYTRLVPLSYQIEICLPIYLTKDNSE